MLNMAKDVKVLLRMSKDVKVKLSGMSKYS